MRSGVYIRVKNKHYDILELTEEQFIRLINTELKELRFNGKGIGDATRERALAQYYSAAKAQPSKRDYLRISLLLTIEEMGRGFHKVREEWENALQELGLGGKQ